MDVMTGWSRALSILSSCPTYVMNRSFFDSIFIAVVFAQLLPRNTCIRWRMVHDCYPFLLPSSAMYVSEHVTGNLIRISSFKTSVENTFHLRDDILHRWGVLRSQFATSSFFMQCSPPRRSFPRSPPPCSTTQSPRTLTMEWSSG